MKKFIDFSQVGLCSRYIIQFNPKHDLNPIKNMRLHENRTRKKKIATKNRRKKKVYIILKSHKSHCSIYGLLQVLCIHQSNPR